ncbi:PTS sugar transporter subunit IIB [Carnobacterium gallinarum]|uniref:PTS sugar transporter subunit IIB n=1 Tax=Carnobacterium gallinarum TaxID=2749 RepID=UPI0005567872|nr:PTS sugar transporter subunit IIB [Carnobacterium gallinarum]
MAEKKTIMLVCSAGMSTSLLVLNMEKAILRRGLDVEVFAISGSDVADFLEKKSIDVMLLGPQVRFMKRQFGPLLEPKGIPVEVISMKDYGLMDGESVLLWAEQLMEK